ncbi:2-isopropylmalate synthase [Alicyclobacillus sendaiensis]|uniref:2-isopropylmalate synthase n=1 Tax=Alicyclobacillus sendaiensis PA2 TaxID=3029425 RepID=A0ABT6Y086_ALISE|nr:2-isopropylmalate synthase [Alicyclobacillus sendaiensis]MDI9260640.1 2-isopropylmalate synthase [Alicyclobacillus sendaiensis PA2]
MKHVNKYTRQYFLPPEPCLDWAHRDHLDHPPIWCSVDLRDGNQALIVPMNLEEKLAYFQLLVEIGFKEIEVGFPAASDTEFEFVRTLIERDLVPDDVTIQVLTQSRDHIIERTFEAIRGAKRAIVHLYNSTSVAQREQVFRADKDEIVNIAVTGAEQIRDLARATPGNFLFQYSPESFTGTELDFALEICNAVLDVWQPTPDRKVIINLPATVELSMPHVYASQIEYMSKHLARRDAIVLSVHPHNDRGTGVAAAELAMLAGAERLEGTLFGNGERTGNVDIVTLALNLYSHGVDPGLDFSNLPAIQARVEALTKMQVSRRHPYAGELVFTAFSGSHQDAIAKGMKWREEKSPEHWTVPYLPIDPKDIGREYEGDIIRINSQSGKGGIGYVLEQSHGYDLPPKMREQLGYAVKRVSDREQKELSADEIAEIFMREFVNLGQPLDLVELTGTDARGSHRVRAKVVWHGETVEIEGAGNGRLDALCHALEDGLGIRVANLTYKEHALEVGSGSRAVAYISVDDEEGNTHFGCGVDTDIMEASAKALVSAVNRMLARASEMVVPVSK